MNPRLAPFLAFSTFAAALVGVACTTVVPETGRKQINMLPPAKEAALGLSEFQKIKQTRKISTDPAYNDAVQRVGKKLSVHMPVPDAQWEFVVFEDPTPNAFALPGGKVGVHTGLFEVTQNDAGLAAVIGHEVAHVVARHSGERASQQVIAGAAVTGAGFLFGADLPASALGAGALVATRAFSRQQELEADRMGAIYMARSGYDPHEAVALWKRFAAWKQKNNEGGEVPTLLSTHPVDEKRIAQLEYYLPEAISQYKKP